MNCPGALTKADICACVDHRPYFGCHAHCSLWGYPNWIPQRNSVLFVSGLPGWVPALRAAITASRTLAQLNQRCGPHNHTAPETLSLQCRFPYLLSKEAIGQTTQSVGSCHSIYLIFPPFPCADVHRIFINVGKAIRMPSFSANGTQPIKREPIHLP